MEGLGTARPGSHGPVRSTLSSLLPEDAGPQVSRPIPRVPTWGEGPTSNLPMEPEDPGSKSKVTWTWSLSLNPASPQQVQRLCAITLALEMDTGTPLTPSPAMATPREIPISALPSLLVLLC